MGEVSNIVRYLYSKFLMRDLLSFILPGAILITSVLLLFLGPSQLFGYVKEVPLIAYVLLFGFCFLVGFFIQCFGTLVCTCHPLIKFYSPRWLDEEERTQTEDDKGNDIKDGSKRVSAIRNIRRMNLQDVYKEHWERIAVLKQMCGNNALALSFSFLIYVVSALIQSGFGTFLTWPGIVVCILYILTIRFLFAGHKQQLDRQMAFEKEVLDTLK